jgi:hypothetical protein
VAVALTIGIVVTDGSSSSLTTPSGEAGAPAFSVESDFVIGIMALTPSELAVGFQRDRAAVVRQQFVAGGAALSPSELAAGLSRDPGAVAVSGTWPASSS